MTFTVYTWQQAAGTSLFFFLGGFGWALGGWLAGQFTAWRAKKP